MTASFIVVFREILEAALIIGIVITLLLKLNRNDLIKGVIVSTVSAVAVSGLLAILFIRILGGFSGRSAELFEGFAMIIGAFLVSTLLLWMIKESDHASQLSSEVESSVSTGRVRRLYALVFVAIIREGVEVVIFIYSLAARSSGGVAAGSILGAAAAAVLGFALFFWGKNVPLRRFFQVTNVLLLLFASGMLAYGIHELQEAGVFPVIVEHIYDINPKVSIDGVYPLLHEKGALGSIAKGLVGYNGNPSLLEVLFYWMYLGVVLSFWRKTAKGRNS